MEGFVQDFKAPVGEIAVQAMMLSMFSEEDPALWFIRSESHFRLHHITDEQTKYDHLVSCLSEKTMQDVRDLIQNPSRTQPYTALKEHLIITYQLSPLQRARQVEEFPPLGDLLPSQMLSRMLIFVQDAEAVNIFFVHQFIKRLPRKVQDRLIDFKVERFEDLTELARRADRYMGTLWYQRQTATSSPHETDDDFYSSSDESELSVVVPSTTPQNNYNYSVSPSLNLCSYHVSSGFNSWKCEGPWCMMAKQTPLGNARAGDRRSSYH